MVDDAWRSNKAYFQVEVFFWILCLFLVQQRI
jgi:hypothetical protein